MKYNALKEKYDNYVMYTNQFKKTSARHNQELKWDNFEKDKEIKYLRQQIVTQKETIEKQMIEIIQLKQSLSVLCGEEIEFKEE